MLSPRDKRRLEDKLKWLITDYDACNRNAEKKVLLKKINDIKNALVKNEKIQKPNAPIIRNQYFTPHQLIECLEQGMMLKEIRAKYGVSYETIRTMKKRYINVKYTLKELDV